MTMTAFSMRSLKSNEVWARSKTLSLRNIASGLNAMRCAATRLRKKSIARSAAAFLFFLTLFFGATLSAYADSIYVKQASLEADKEGGWNLNADFAFDIKGALEEALQKGIALYFTVDFKLTHPRWYWFDERKLTLSRTRRVSYQPLTREYRLSSGGLQLRFTSLNDLLSALGHLSMWHVIAPNAIKTDQPYIASLRMRLDPALMPKPFQINAINNRDWNLSSEWTHFTFIARSHARAQ